MRAWVWAVIAASCAFGADPSLERAKALAEEGQAEQAVALYAQILSRPELDPESRAIARYERALLLERDLSRTEEALREYRRYLLDSRNLLPRTTRVVQDKIAELESELGPDGELWREIAAAENGTYARSTQEEAERLGDLLYRFQGSGAAREGYLALARVCQDPGVADWRRSLSALSLAAKHGASEEEVQGLRERAHIEWRRLRVFCACVALGAFLLAASLCLAPWRSLRKGDLSRAAVIAIPGVLFCVAWSVLGWLRVPLEPVMKLGPQQTLSLMAMGIAVLANTTLLSAVFRTRPLGRLVVLLAALLLSLSSVGVYCHLYDCFKVLGL